MAALARALGFFAPDIAVLEFPAWDCLPYDRVSPHAGVRRAAHDRAVAAGARQGPRPARRSCSRPSTPRSSACRRGTSWRGNRSRSRPATCSPWTASPRWLELNGFMRASTVREPGDYAVRGGIIDLYRARAWPSRCGSISSATRWKRSAASIRRRQRTTDQLRALDLVPVAEFQLTTETIRRFRLGYVEAFGAPTPDDLLYHAVSEGRRHPGMEHWLPLFHDRLDTLLRLRAGLAGRARAAGRGRGARAARPDQGLLRGAAAGA